MGAIGGSDDLYDSYNLIDFDADQTSARITHLPEMLEGQVAVLESGFLSPEDRRRVIDALFASALFRPDQGSFMLYPARHLPTFLEKNVVPEAAVASNDLLRALVAAGDTSIIRIDADGVYRFASDFGSATEVAAALEQLGSREDWHPLVSASRDATLRTYEEVFRHHEYTGRSGSMYGYEGIGSIYWHMVAKLLVATQESIIDARDQGAPADTVRHLVEGYWRVRSGLGFNKTAAEYGAFPIDPYSHTPAHAGAQQPGMTGQVKEELLTRLLEVGVRIDDGEICFDPILLRADELLPGPETWPIRHIDGTNAVIDLPAGSLGFTLCEVPIIVALTSGPAAVEVALADGSRDRRSGLRLDRETSALVFGRFGEIAGVTAFIPEAEVPPGCGRCCPWPVTRSRSPAGLRAAEVKGVWTPRQPFPATGATRRGELAPLCPELVDLFLVTVRDPDLSQPVSAHGDEQVDARVQCPSSSARGDSASEEDPLGPLVGVSRRFESQGSVGELRHPADESEDGIAAVVAAGQA